MDDQATPDPGLPDTGPPDTGPADPAAALAGRDYGEVLWQPGPEAISSARVTAYARWLAARHGLDLRNHDQLWQWSVTEPAEFWESVWDYFGVLGDRGTGPALSDAEMPGTRWFEGATLNYARNALRTARTEPDRTAVIYRSEDGSGGTFTYGELEREVARVSAGLRALGVTAGDRVAAYLPNVPEALIAMLATASLGGIWSSCSPDFGAGSVIDRFAQISPKVLVAVGGYTYGGKVYDRTGEVASIAAALPGLAAVLLVRTPGAAASGADSPAAAPGTPAPGTPAPGTPAPGTPAPGTPAPGTPAPGTPAPGTAAPGTAAPGPAHPGPRTVGWDSLPAGDPAAQPEFTEVPFSHPLWVLYSSGTTGLPKPIVHGHGGIVLEHLKVLAFHQDVGPDDVFFWYTTTGWMMWNYLVGGLLAGATVVLYDGSANHPALDALWRLIAETGVTYAGTGAPYLLACAKAGLRPGAEHDLSKLRGVGSTGSPLPPEGFRWVYDAVGSDLLLGSFSGGTDLCTGFVGPSPLLPVRAGVIAGRCLGAKVEAYDPGGNPVTGEVGELVITRPMPSMPVGFWNDPGGERYRASYFAEYPGVWRHGDWIMFLPDGGCVIYGRSDATLNRGGVRMGTSEFYRVVERLPEIADSLVIDTGGLGRDGRLILYVVLADGAELDDGLIGRIRSQLRSQLSPRHVPDEINQVPGIPRTLSGKKLEVPVRKILLGTPLAEAADPDALANPEVLAFFAPREPRGESR
jgi:acetoacetyl-CoA synthetase